MFRLTFRARAVRQLLFLPALLAGLLVFAALGIGQVITGSIVGSVMDNTGAVLPGTMDMKADPVPASGSATSKAEAIPGELEDAADSYLTEADGDGAKRLLDLVAVDVGEENADALLDTAADRLAR